MRVDHSARGARLDTSHTPPLTEAWYVACHARRLKPGKMLATRIVGEPLLVGRDADGKAFALLDICPHRAIPLSCGGFDGREVECRYHGWRFNSEGRCTRIPGLVADQTPDLGPFSVRRFPVQERYGAVWVYMGKQPDVAPTLPDLPSPAGDRPNLALTMTFPSDVDHAVIGLMDPAHGTFVHRSWFWRKSALDKQKQFAPSPWGFTMVRHAPSANSRAYNILGKGERSTEISFRLPGIRTEIIEAGRHRVCNLTALTPVDHQTTEVHQFSWWTNPLFDLLKPILRRFAVTFIGQDRDVVALQREGLRYGSPLLLLGDPDAQARWYFRLKNEYRRSLDEGRAFVNPVKERVLKWRS